MKPDRASQQLIKNLGKKLKALRAVKGWTLEETEQHGWTSWRHLQKIEAGKNVTLITLTRLGKLYGVEPYELLK